MCRVHGGGGAHRILLGQLALDGRAQQRQQPGLGRRAVGDHARAQQLLQRQPRGAHL